MAALFAQLTSGFDRLSIKIDETNQRLGQQVHDVAAGLHTVNQTVEDFRQVTQAKFEELEVRIANGPPPPKVRPLWPQPSAAQRAASAPPVRDLTPVDHKVLIAKNVPYEMTTHAFKEVGEQIFSHLPDNLSKHAKAASKYSGCTFRLELPTDQQALLGLEYLREAPFSWLDPATSTFRQLSVQAHRLLSSRLQGKVLGHLWKKLAGHIRER